MAELPDTAVHQADVLYLSGDRSVSRDLHHQYRRQKQLYCTATLWPLALPLFYVCTPTLALIVLATPINDLFWSHFKSISFETCGAKCSLVAFSVIAVSLAYVGTVVFGVLSAFAAIQFRTAQLEALRRGLAPLGRMPDGAAKRPPTGPGAILAGIIAMMLGVAILLAFAYVLYEISGSDRTTHARTGREYATVLVSVLMTFLISIVQLISTVVMAAAGLTAIDLKNLLKI